eukprot:TRINITY_DN1790_c0_g1_i1.p1 TRINITY_DN1790_c0_g1~~TRINITY_DN1790_c0_g1_i1.p1  ORF type:complete len:360 (-),score=29.52 TRINITY_DN1790_c0_g1_i1:67-1080(-)
MATLAENAKGDEESGGHRVVEFSAEVNMRTKADQINHSFLVSGMYIMLWYVPNIMTLLLNKYIYKEWEFTYPLTLTTIHMMCCSVGAYLAIKVFKVVPELNAGGFKAVFPLAVLFCVNIVLGNISLRWVPVSFMQTVKSSVPAFTIFLQTFCFPSKPISRMTYFALIPIVGGVTLATYTEVNFEVLGFGAALTASLITALQAHISGKLLSTKLDSINLLYNMAPLAVLMLVLPTLYLESGDIRNNWKYAGQSEAMLTLVVSGFLAFALNVTQFLAIAKTSPLTFTVAGNLKVVISISLSVFIFQNQVTVWNGVGCAVALGGVMWYNRIRYQEAHQKK